MGWSPWPSPQARLDLEWGGLAIWSMTFSSVQEASGASQGELPRSSTCTRCGPDACHIWSTRASGVVETPPQVPGQTAVSVSPQVPCRLRAARSRTKASTSVWRPTLQALVTRPLPTYMCEVRTQVVPNSA